MAEIETQEGWFDSDPVTDGEADVLRRSMNNGGLCGSNVFAIHKTLLKRLLDTREGLTQAIRASVSGNYRDDTKENMAGQLEFLEEILTDCEYGYEWEADDTPPVTTLTDLSTGVTTVVEEIKPQHQLGD